MPVKRPYKRTILAIFHVIIRRLSETLVLVSDEGWADPAQLARALNASIYPGVEEVVAAYETVGVYGKPQKGWEDWIASHASGLESKAPGGRRHEIPVCYEIGEDLDDVARELGLGREEVMAHHLEAVYRCFAVGFQPGFGYLGPLSPPLRGLPRRTSPRTRVEPGAVGICQNQTAVYPSASPGGWNLIGRCPLCLVDVDSSYFPIEAGDLVQFRRISEVEFARLRWQLLN